LPASINGVVILCSANPFPLTVALEIVTLAGPEFFGSTVCDFVVPTGTLPKGSLVSAVVKVFGAIADVAVGLNSSVPWPAALLAVVPPHSNAVNTMIPRTLRLRARFSFCWEFGRPLFCIS
jgi:hypothetical protein